MSRGTIFRGVLMVPLVACVAASLRAQAPTPAADPSAADKPPRESVVASITGAYLPPMKNESGQAHPTQTHRIQARNGMVFELDTSRYPALKDYLDRRSLEPRAPIRVLGWINPVSPGLDGPSGWACTVQRLELIGPDRSASEAPPRDRARDAPPSMTRKLNAIQRAGGLTVSVPRVKKKDATSLKARADLYDRAKALTERAGVKVEDIPLDRANGRFFAAVRKDQRLDPSLLNSLEKLGVDVMPFPFPGPTFHLPNGERAGPVEPSRFDARPAEAERRPD